MNGILRKVDFFYDLRNEVFKVMFLGDKFLSEFFILDRWFLFMKMIGMVCEVFCDYFKRFIVEVV